MKTDNARRKAIKNVFGATAAGMLGFGFEDTGSAADLPGHGFDDASLSLGPKAHSRSKSPLPFRISMNTSTLMAYKLPVDEQIDLVGKAGFEGIELWMRDIQAYVDKGGDLASLKKKLIANDLVLENIIAFSQWCSDDRAVREEALDLMRSEMTMVATLGGGYFAAPVQGIEKIDPMKYESYAERYRAVLEVGDETGVVPLIELWGMGALHKISDAAKIIIESKHPKAALLLDFYHVHRGGNDWTTIDTLNAQKFPVIHLNDYPATPEAELLTDADRVLPGEGVCPFDELLPRLYQAGFRGGLSMELFNKTYWETMDAETLLKKSYEATRTTIEKAMPELE